MTSVVSRLQQARLYGILDLGYVGARDPLSMARQMIQGGVGVLQLRAKGKKAADILELSFSLAQLCRESGTVYIVNDFPEVARETNADGVHVGQEDGGMEGIRARLNPGQIVGRSTHGLDQALGAEREGADYIGIGPIFLTPTKPDYIPVGMKLIQEVQSRVSIPGFCIGGIKLENLDQVLDAGAKRVVIVSGILMAEDIAGYCRAVLKKMQ
jgi:thiamine-phosphate pyrophosphorylase